MTSTDSPLSTPSVDAVRPSSEALLQLAVGAAEDRKALDLRVLDLAEVSDFTDWFLICSGTNERQVKAIAESILDRLRDNRAKPLHVEGLRNGSWVLLDFGGEMVIHVFREDTRKFYGLDRLWSDAPDHTERYHTPSNEAVTVEEPAANEPAANEPAANEPAADEPAADGTDA